MRLKIDTLLPQKVLEKDQRRKVFIIWKEKCIAHGSLGLAVFDLSERKFNYVNRVNTKNKAVNMANPVKTPK